LKMSDLKYGTLDAIGVGAASAGFAMLNTEKTALGVVLIVIAIAALALKSVVVKNSKG